MKIYHANKGEWFHKVNDSRAIYTKVAFVNNDADMENYEVVSDEQRKEAMLKHNPLLAKLKEKQNSK